MYLSHTSSDYTNIPDTLMIRCGAHTRPTEQENKADPFGGDDKNVEKQPANQKQEKRIKELEMSSKSIIYVSMFLHIFDQLSTLVRMFSKSSLFTKTLLTN